MAVIGPQHRRAFKKLRDERGSISVLTIGLFVVSVALLVLVTNVASVVVSKQSLVHASEAAVIRASHEVDLAAYYRGDSREKMPIDCRAAFQSATDEMNLWIRSEGSDHRSELQQIWMTNFICSGDRVQLSVSARAVLPFRLPQSDPDFEIHATVEAQSDREG